MSSVRSSGLSLMQRSMGVLAAAAAGGLASSAAAQLRVCEYNIAALKGNATAFQTVLASLHTDDKPGFAAPVSVIYFQEVRAVDIAPLTAAINAAAPAGVSYTLATYTTSAGEDGSAGAQAMFYRTGFLSEIVAAHQDISTGAGRNSDRWKLQLVGYPTTASFYVYSSHLKASQGFETERLNGAIALRNNSDSLPAGANIIMGGDLNMYVNTEPAYAEFISAGNGQCVDQFGNGTWAGAANAIKHSQSPLFTSVNGLVGGGMNDRFDIQFSSNAMNDGVGFSYIPGTYRSVGNDGMHYNVAINNGNNFYFPGQLARSNALAANLAAASDHVPLIVDYQIPAKMAGSIVGDYGRVIQNASFNIPISVTNPADVVVVQGADLLEYEANGSLGLSGTFTDTVQALGDVSAPSFPLNTSVVGVRAGKVTLSALSEAAQPASLALNTTGTIVRKSDASFSNSGDANNLTLPLSFDPDTGVQQFTVQVFNFGYDSLQALLDVDSVSSLSSPFAYVGGAAAGIGSSPATLTFAIDTDGLSSGLYSTQAIIHVSDENIPGETATTLALQIDVTIGTARPCLPDVNGDATVDIDDLFSVINAWGACADPRACPADVNGDDQVDIDDLFSVINAWGACP